MIALCAFLLTVGAQAPAAPSVAVMPLTARQGVSADLADLLTDNLTKYVRDSGRFSHVVSAKEVQTSLNFEMQRQLLQCTDTSCMSELAASLGVAFLITGSVGKVGNLYLFNASVVAVSTGQNAGQVSETIPGNSEDELLRAMPDVVNKLIQTMGEKPVADTPKAAKAPVVVEENAGSTGFSPLMFVGVGVAAVFALGLVGALVLGAGGAVTAVSSEVVFNTVRGADYLAIPLTILLNAGGVTALASPLLVVVGAIGVVVGAVVAVVLR